MNNNMASLSVEYDDTFQKWYYNFVLHESIYCICQLAMLFFIQSWLYVYNLIWASKKKYSVRVCVSPFVQRISLKRIDISLFISNCYRKAKIFVIFPYYEVQA